MKVELNLTHTTVHQILTNELGIGKICTKMFPKTSCSEKKDISTERCLDFLQSIENDPQFLEVLLLVTSLGSSSVTQKPSARARNGTLQPLHGLKKQE